MDAQANLRLSRNGAVVGEELCSPFLVSVDGAVKSGQRLAGTARREGENMVPGWFDKLEEGIGLEGKRDAYPFCVMSPSYMENTRC